MNILFYIPINNRCRNIESQALEFKKDKHEVFLLSHHQPQGEVHDFFNANGFITDSYVATSSIKGVSIIKYVIHLIRFCKRNKIDIIYSHVDAANLIAVIAQYFIRANVIVARHHADVLWLLKDYKNYRISKLIYRLAKTVEAVSANAKKWMIDEEGVNPDKINVIPISYNWDLFQIPSIEIVYEIKKRYSSELLLSTAARFLPSKRIDDIIEMVESLRNKEIDVQLLIMGDGIQREELTALVKQKKLERCVHFLGFVDNILPYVAASDLYVHFSESEASCVAVKEAALVNTPVMVCHGVGDFDDYLVMNETALFVRKDNAVEDGIIQLTEISKDKSSLKKLGENLNHKVLKYFNIINVMPVYNRLMKFKASK